MSRMFCQRQLIFFLSFVVIATATVPSTALAHFNQEWVQFKKTFNRTYNTIVDQYRREVWEENVKEINRHNEEFVKGKHSYWLRVNQFTDLTWYEFKKTMLGLLDSNLENVTYTDAPPIPGVFLPDQVDWTKEGYVTPVKNQGKCGSCWAFATTGVVEGQLKKTSGKLTSLSEQNLIDCSVKYGNRGCQGGWPTKAMKYIQVNGGIDTEFCYPYEGKEGACRYKSSCSTAKISGYKIVSGTSETNLKNAIAAVGPVAVLIYADRRFQSYGGGVYDDTSCESHCASLNHAVLAVGYGTLDGKDFWKVKNSWGTRWGMQGYILMSRNKNNQCGIACRPSYPTM